MLIQQVAGGGWTNSGGTVPNAINERIFRVARNSYTKTATASTFARGGPANLATASASTNGYDIVQPDTQGANDNNNLLIGLVQDFPDTSVGRTGTWQPEDVGLVQCYGLNTNAILQVASTTIAAGLIMTPDTGSQFKTCADLVIQSAGTATVATNLAGMAGIGGLVVLAQTVASQAAGTKAVAAFIRCM